MEQIAESVRQQAAGEVYIDPELREKEWALTTLTTHSSPMPPTQMYEASDQLKLIMATFVQAGAPRGSFAPSLIDWHASLVAPCRPTAGTRRTKNRWGQVGLAGPVVHAGAPFHGPMGPRDRRPLGRQGRDLGALRGAPGSGSPAVRPARASISWPQASRGRPSPRRKRSLCGLEGDADPRWLHI